MTGPSGNKEGLGLVGVGAAACMACCAGPLLAFLGGLTIAGLASTLLIGAAGLAIAAIAGGGWLAIRRRRVRAIRAAHHGQPVAVTAPRVRADR